MNTLEQLKKRLLGQKKQNNNQIFNLCAVMEVVGGYDQLKNLPIPTLNWIIRYLEEKNKNK